MPTYLTVLPTTINGVKYWAPNLGPLTTTFTPPTSCFKDLYYLFTLDPGSVRHPSLAWITKTECYPTNYPQEDSWYYAGYYSPAVCPSGYWSACVEHESLVAIKETGFVCCPR